MHPLTLFSLVAGQHGAETIKWKTDYLSRSPRLYRLFITERSLSLAESFSGVT